MNLPQLNPKKLHSPLLDGNKKDNNIKGKRTYYNSHEENKSLNIIDKTLDRNLFNKREKEDFSLINYNLINSLETAFKIGNIFICATGGILSILELINIIRTIYNGSSDFENSILVFTVAFIGTILASVVCHGFIHLIKTTKYIYLNIESLRSRLL